MHGNSTLAAAAAARKKADTCIMYQTYDLPYTGQREQQRLQGLLHVHCRRRRQPLWPPGWKVPSRRPSPLVPPDVCPACYRARGAPTSGGPLRPGTTHILRAGVSCCWWGGMLPVCFHSCCAHVHSLDADLLRILRADLPPQAATTTVSRTRTPPPLLAGSALPSTTTIPARASTISDPPSW